MTYTVTQPCAVDASCVLACPVNCIHPAPGEPGFAEAVMLHIDPATCVGCGACTTACPVGAIVPASDLTPEQAPFLAMNADYFLDSPHDDRPPLAPVEPAPRLRRRGGVRVAVVGAGPAGLFTADELLRVPGVSLDVLDRLEHPHGLARYGVAPDHLSTRSVCDLFGAIEATPGFGYRLGVEVGRDVTHEQLREQYDAVVYATGASAARRLDVDGADRVGSVTAGDLARWYNAHPDLTDWAELPVPLGHERAVVVGAGNVALDVARILTAGPARLDAMDLQAAVREQLPAGVVREVVLLARRGPSEVAFTLPELVGLGGLVRGGELRVALDTGGRRLDLGDRRAALLAELEQCSTVLEDDVPRLVLRFHSAIRRIHGAGAGEQGPVAAIDVERDGSVERIRTGLVVASIGFRCVPPVDLPTDPATGAVAHRQGRVVPGTYVVGWLKRGPRGFIGTNRTDARETVAALLADLDSAPEEAAHSVSCAPAPTGADPRAGAERAHGTRRPAARR